MTRIPVTTPISPAERIPVHEGAPFTGEHQFDIHEASTPADLSAAEATFTVPDPGPRRADAEVIVGYAPRRAAVADRAPVVWTPRAKMVGKFAAGLTTALVIAGIGFSTAAENRDKTNFQNAINERADSR